MLSAREIEELVCHVIESKIERLNETDVSYKLFYTPLLGTDILLTHQIVHRIFSAIGRSVFEKVACIVARDNFDEVNTSSRSPLGSVSSTIKLYDYRNCFPFDTGQGTPQACNRLGGSS